MNHPESDKAENIAAFILEIQTYSKGRIVFPIDLEFLIRESNGRGFLQPFQDAMFHAKFAVKTQEVMKRIGPKADGFDKLAAEFQSSVEKATALLKTIVKEAAEQPKQRFAQRFFSMDQDGFSNLMKLFSDLAWVKNWENDGKQIPIRN